MDEGLRGYDMGGRAYGGVWLAFGIINTCIRSLKGLIASACVKLGNIIGAFPCL